MEIHNTDILFDVLHRIDYRTDQIDKRLRDVEQKVNNGLTDRVKVLHDGFCKMQEEQQELWETAKTLSTASTLRQKIWRVAYMILGIFIGVAGVIATIMATQ